MLALRCALALVLAACMMGHLIAADTLVQVEYTLKTPRSRPPVLGGEKDKLLYTVWIPDGVKVVRGAVCNPFSKGDGPGKHWQSVCRLWQFAYVQMDYDAVKKDEFLTLKTALTDLAKKSGHPELEFMPFCYTGMSRGGGMTMAMAELMPERTIACVPVCLEVGPSSEATRKIPVVTVFGEKDGSQMPKLLAKLPAERAENARFAIAVQWGLGHEFALANNLSYIFMDDVIRKRVPETPSPKEAPRLKDIPLEDGWLVDQATWKEPRPVIASFADYKGKSAEAGWLPSKRLAAVWQAFVSPSAKQIKISEPPGLGGGQPFVLHSAGKPIKVGVSVDEKLSATHVQLYDADVLLAERKQALFEFEVTLKPGVHSLIATVMDENGKPGRLSRPHTIVVSE